MPNSRHQRNNHRHRDEDAHNNNHHHHQSAPAASTREVAAAGSVNSASTGNHAHQNDNNAAGGARIQKCCTPGVCRSPEEAIDSEEPLDAVKVLCNNESCTQGTWMHKDCFEDFEQSVLAYLRSCGRARSWSEKQRLQNLWTKKGYDLAFKACDCKCGRGHLRKNLDYVPAPCNDSSHGGGGGGGKKPKKHKKKNDKPMPVVSTTHKANSHSGHQGGGGHVHGTTNATAPAAASSSSSTTATAAAANANNTRGQANHASSSSTTTNNNNGGRSEKKGKKSAATTTTTTTTTALKGLDGPKSDSNGNLPHDDDALDNHRATTTPSLTNNGHVLTPTPTTPYQGIFPGNNVVAAVGGGGHNPQLRLRTNSVSSTGSAASHSSSHSSHSSSSSILPSSSAGSGSPISSSPTTTGGGGDMFFKSRRQSSDASSEGGVGVGGSGWGFRQRVDLSAFAALPRNRQNPYHIRVEDAGTLASSFTACSLAAAKAPPPRGSLAEAGPEAGGCDLETRGFVLGNLLSKRVSSARCALCKLALPVFDRFPLLDGTFFLSPQSYDETAIQVIWEGRLQFLNAACLACLEGHNQVKCLACKRPWNGCNLVVGSMYTYDILAAMPCCQKRLTCKCCRRAVVDITKGLEFYSQYSQMIICPYCHANDYHFIRSLSETFSVSEAGAGCGEPICH